MAFLWDTVVESIQGNGVVNAVMLKNVKTGAPATLEVEGVFIYIGLAPNTDFVKGLLPLDPGRHILVNARMETAVPGIFAAGDVRLDSMKRVASAVGEGAMAVYLVHRYLATT